MKTVLIIDDDPIIRDLLASLLARKDFLASHAANGEDAITQLTEARREDGGSEFDLVLIDLVMPKLSGWSVLAFIERSMPEMIEHVLVVSGENEVQLRELENRGACGTILRKPFDVEEFYQKISGCIRESSDHVMPAIHLKAARRPTAADVIDRIMDKGIVIECQAKRVSLGVLGLPVTMDARYVVVSLDTYLEYAEALRTTGS